MLSLIELKNKKVEAKRKKYDSDEMDAYLELVYENYNELLEANKKLESEKFELNKNVKKLSDGVQYYRSIETTLQKALILAEKTSKETKDAAVLKAEAIEKEAHQKANAIIQDASTQYKEIQAKCVELCDKFENYKAQLKKATEEQINLLASDTFNVTPPSDFNEEFMYQAPTVDVATKPEASDIPVASTVIESPIIETPVIEKEAVQEPISKPVEAPLSATIPSAIVVENDAKTNTVALEDEILNADTIDLRTTLDAVKAVENEANQAEIPVQSDSVVPETTPIQSTPIKAANVVEPVVAKVVEPTEISFKESDLKEESINAAADTTKEIADTKKEEPVDSQPVEEKITQAQAPKESLDSMVEPKSESVPTLDSLLQDLNINNKSKQNSDDPFEFLGSVDDF